MSEWMSNTIGVLVIVFLVIATVVDLVIGATLLTLVGRIRRDKHETQVSRPVGHTAACDPEPAPDVRGEPRVEERQPARVG